MDLPAKKASDLPRKGYTGEEISDIYALGRTWLESGNVRRAETVMNGINEVAPDFSPAWLGSAYIKSLSGDLDGALAAAKSGLKCAPDSVEAMLYVVTLSLTLGDFSAAGTYLGEVGERIEDGHVVSPSAVRMYKMQLSRYQARN
jgi:Flp pilus assembly protein TadD